jgi:membrane glycosyltransferase
MFLESLFSALLAPVRMLFHTQFVAGALTGRARQWKSPPREDAETTWGEAFQRHGLHSVLGIVWAAGVYWLNPSFLGWLAPVVGALALSIPISVLSSRVGLGRRARAARLFLIPEEGWPPRELRRMRHWLRRAPVPPSFEQALRDPALNALMCATAPWRSRSGGVLGRQREALVREALQRGLRNLGERERGKLLNDPSALAELHYRLSGAGTRLHQASASR